MYYYLSYETCASSMHDDVSRATSAKPSFPIPGAALPFTGSMAHWLLITEVHNLNRTEKEGIIRPEPWHQGMGLQAVST